MSNRQYVLDLEVWSDKNLLYKAPIAKSRSFEEAVKLLQAARHLMAAEFANAKIESLNLVHDGIEFVARFKGYDYRLCKFVIKVVEMDDYSHDIFKMIEWLNDPKTLPS